MGRRLEVELTSTRDDGSWTWRAAGAKQPKGVVTGSLLYDGAQIGDVVKAEADFHVDGIEITEVFIPKKKKARTNILEMKPRALRDDELVTTQRVKKERGNRRRGDRKGGRKQDRNDRNNNRNERGNRRSSRPAAEARPKPKRLRAKRQHRDKLLAEVGEVHQPIIEQLLRDGMPGVRKAIEKQNTEAKEAGKPEVDSTPILAIAEKNVTKARLAEWRDKADAALAETSDLDIRDLRSVVVSGNDLARDEESRGIADQLKTTLNERVESDHTSWLSDLEAAIAADRVVRALRLSSRPVKAGAPLPAEMATKLAAQTSESLSADVGQDRWATVLDALAFSPVRGAVTPAGIPAEPSKDLIAAVRRLSDRVPAIAALFGVDPAEVPKSAKRRRPRRTNKSSDKKTSKGSKSKNKKEETPKPAEEPAAIEEPTPVATTEPAATEPTPIEEPTPVATTEPEKPAGD